ncbi:HAMP domain-containing sensor histidine kinase [Tissierella carlieri]|jgi:signal transduction histidine kinase|uniref:sensor histidine kinase n=3 Tax=Tissierella TaxID=41273 RepID=UPI002805B438|nr:HAMP domain-containing sensor histidine kinase [uncultured Tissierella sp.]MDU5082406.1 HAMP domain-containing sensor histidine kinase [Bacillota bacterium]
MFYMRLLLPFMFFTIFYLVYKRYMERKRLNQLVNLLKEVESGNYSKRGVIPLNDEYSEIYYLINKIIRRNQNDIIEINRLNQGNKRILTSLSHDIKTPIASLLGYLEAIDKKLVDEDEREEYFKIALNKAYKLNEYTNELFQLLQLESGEYILRNQSCNICEETRRSFIAWVPILEKHNIKYKVNIPEGSIITTLDVQAYERILDNLIKNAIIHSRCEEISIDLIEKENMIQVKISDDGIGIPRNSKDMIIDRLYKVDTSRKTKGSGLGLAIVKELADKCNISLKYDSEEGKGSSFILGVKKAL